MRIVSVVLILLAVSIAVLFSHLPARASVASDAGQAVLDFAQDTLLTPDMIGLAPGDPWTLNFSRKVDLAGRAGFVGKLPGLRSIDFYSGLSIASSGPTIRSQWGVGITNIKGNRLSLTAISVPYDDATWRLPIVAGLRFGWEPRFALGREF